MNDLLAILFGTLFIGGIIYFYARDNNEPKQAVLIVLGFFVVFALLAWLGYASADSGFSDY